MLLWVFPVRELRHLNRLDCRQYRRVNKMKRLSTLIVAVALPLAVATAAMAQDGNQEGKTLGTVVNGNTTTEFKAADSRDLDVAKLKTWNDFAANHPDIAKELA